MILANGLIGLGILLPLIVASAALAAILLVKKRRIDQGRELTMWTGATATQVGGAVIFGLVFTAIFGFAGYSLMTDAADGLARSVLQEDWLVIEATVEATELGGLTDPALVRYSYSVDDASYTQEETLTGEIAIDARFWEVGDQVTIYSNPSAPAESTALPPPDPLERAALAGVYFAGIGLMLFVYAYAVVLAQALLTPRLVGERFKVHGL
ncbi:MAG: DUF3592 domain-containing protein [Chloroflexi bacterium]|nr:DUF3592 domain-containing protein [Chloroflexota bacterium]